MPFIICHCRFHNGICRYLLLHTGFIPFPAVYIPFHAVRIPFSYQNMPVSVFRAVLMPFMYGMYAAFRSIYHLDVVFIPFYAVYVEILCVLHPCFGQLATLRYA